MVLFEVPGWETPKEGPATNTTKKRKRPVHVDDSKVQAAHVNLEKLMKKLDKKDDEHESRRSKKRKADGKEEGDRQKQPKKDKRKDQQQRVDKKLHGESNHPGSSKDHASTESSSKDNVKKGKRKSKLSSSQSPPEPAHDNLKNAESSLAQQSSSQLTSLQENMKKSLDGARFRWINETLYMSDSTQAVEMMVTDPKVYEEYHIGFRHQVTSWPSNPVSHFTAALSDYPKYTVIVDLGCGDAALARSLIPSGFVVHSYDLIAANPFVVAADVCDKLPLPGAEGTGHEGQVVDVVVCSLSLMNTNWLKCVREARRVLKPGGELKIAEVASRFTDVKEFTSLVCAVGFRLVSKDDKNTHFTLFDFKKTDSRSLDEKSWEKLLSRSSVLQPCEYKRR